MILRSALDAEMKDATRAEVALQNTRAEKLPVTGRRKQVKGKGKGPFYLTSVVPSVPTRLLSMEADGAPSTPPCHCQCSVLRVFKAIATRIRGKSKQTLKSLKIELGTSRSESHALAN